MSLPNYLRIPVILCALLAISVGSYPEEAHAVPANPDPYLATQPNGENVTLRLSGDEWSHFEETLDGYTVLRKRGWLYYAQQDRRSGQLVPTKFRVGLDSPVGRVRRGERPTLQARQEEARLKGTPLSTHEEVEKSRQRRIELTGGSPALADGTGSQTASAPELAGVSTSGTLKNLVVMIRWSDHGGRALPSSVDVDILMNNDGPHALAPTGSVRDVYLENSYGSLALDSHVTEWVTSNNTEAYYAAGSSGLVSTFHEALKDALNKVDQTVDFRDFDTNGDGLIDAITFLHSGYGAEWGGSDAYGTSGSNRIWSHKWSIWYGWTSEEGISVYDYHISPAIWGTSGSSIGRIGVIAHETGHFLGLPDLYDTDGSGGSGIGSYGLMANSWGFDGSQYYPPHLSPWSKINLGWLTPTLIESSGVYSISQAETQAQAYKITQGYPSGEYLLIENRQPAGFDAAMPQGGLAIWHIDENAGYYSEGYPVNGAWAGDHYRVSLLQADGLYDLEHGYDRGDSGDLWHANGNDEIGVSTAPGSGPFPNTDAYQGGQFTQSNNRIFGISAAAAEMSFTYQIVGEPTEPPTAPSGLIATAQGSDQVALAWQDLSADETSFVVERSLDGVNFATLATLAAESTQYLDTGLNADTYYAYRVYAQNGAGASATTAVASVTTDPPPPPPVAPSQLVATALSYSAVSLSWSDNSSDETAFIVERSLDGVNFAPIASLDANNTQYTDTGLSADTYYAYRVYAQNSIGDSEMSAVASVTTNPPPPPPVAPSQLVASALSESRISLGWSDNSSDESAFIVERSLDGASWSQLATLSANAVSYVDQGLEASTSYSYRVSASNEWGTSTSGSATATTDAPPAYVDHFAQQDIFVTAAVAGTVSRLSEVDGSVQQVIEIESGGKPSRRTSYLEHQWEFSNVRGGLAITVFITAWAPANSEQDNFNIEVSFNGGAWAPLLTIMAGSPEGGSYSAQLTSSLSGTYRLRVVDTNRTEGARIFDSVYIDQLFLRTDLDPNDTPPNPPTSLVATAISASRVDLAWVDQSNNERGFNIYRSVDGGNQFSLLTTTGSDTDTFADLSVSPNTTYHYQVEAFTTSYAGSSNISAVTTPDGLALSGSGYKRRGKAYADLVWVGGGSSPDVEILRSTNGSAATLISRTAHSAGGSYTDATGLGGSNTFVYLICTPSDLGPVLCSNTITLVF